MAIDRNDIIAFVNEALQTNFSGTDLDVAIKTCLNDLSKSNLLTGEDTTQTLADGDETLDYPDCFKQEITITLNDGSNDLAPLVPLAGGFREYKNLMRSFNAGLRSNPTQFAKNNNKIFIYPTAGASFTTDIWFYKHHAQSADTFEFGDDAINAINFGTTHFKSHLMRREWYADKWIAFYENEKIDLRAIVESQVSILRG